MGKLRSLHCGINYLGTSSELSGCHNDCFDWERECASRGFITQTLLEKEATKDGFLAALTDAVGRTGWRDTLVVSYSGHGSWVPDTSGDEPDKRDEVLVTVDYRARGYVTDDELHEVFQKRRFGAHIFFVSDSCHSGSVARNFLADAPAAKPRFMPPAELLADQPTILSQARDVEKEPARGVSRTGPLLLSGCADTEYSYDAFIDGRANGALTRTALNILHAGQVGSYAEWHREVRRVLGPHNEEYPQSPQLVGTAWQKRRPPLT